MYNYKWMCSFCCLIWFACYDCCCCCCRFAQRTNSRSGKSKMHLMSTPTIRLSILYFVCGYSKLYLRAVVVVVRVPFMVCVWVFFFRVPKCLLQSHESHWRMYDSQQTFTIACNNNIHLCSSILIPFTNVYMYAYVLLISSTTELCVCVFNMGDRATNAPRTRHVKYFIEKIVHINEFMCVVCVLRLRDWNTDFNRQIFQWPRAMELN